MDASLDGGQQFIGLYNQMDHWLRDFTGAEHGSFFQRIDRAARKHSLIRRHSDELKDFGELRNAIIHHERYPEVIIASPHPDVLLRFKRLMDELTNPERLIPLFSRKVNLLRPTDSLAQALSYIADKGYSQVPVKADGRYGMLTNDGIARWLAAQVAGECLDLGKATVGDVLTYEPEESFMVVSRYMTLDEARTVFEHARVMSKPRLYALLITENGEHEESLLGIVTPYDLVVKD